MVKVFSSYYQKLIILHLILSLVPILIISGYLYYDKINDEKKNLEEKLTFISQSDANNIAAWIEERKNNVYQIAKNELIISETKNLLNTKNNEEEIFMNRFALEKQLHSSITIHDWLKELMIADPKTGQIIFSTNMVIPDLNFIEQTHFQKALSRQIGVSEIFPSETPIKNEYGKYEKGVPTLLISVPIAGEVGLEGILIARVDIFMMNSDMENYIRNFKTSDTYIVDSNGYFISQSKFQNTLLEKNLIEKRPQLELRIIEPNSNELTKIFRDLKNANTHTDLIGYQNYLGSNVVGSITPIKNTNWYFIVEVDKTEAFLEISKLQVILLTSIIVIILTVVITSILFASTLVNPIKNLTKYVENFDVNIHKENILDFEKLNHGRSDEIANLYQTFKHMTESIRKSTSALKLAEQKYRSLYDDLPDLCRTINKDGIILDCNKAYAKSLGYSKKAIIGKSIFKHVPSDSINELRASFNTWRNEGTVFNREVKLKRKDGTVFSVLISATNLYDSQGHLIGSNTLIKDISEIQTLLEVDKAKDEFASMVSHELKTPLIPIMGYCEMLRDPKFFGNLSEPQLEAINEIYDSATRLSNMINEVLKAQKLELNKLSLQKEYFDVEEFLDLVIKNHSYLMTQKQITLITNFLSNKKLIIKSDKNRLLEVFTNLIQNAVDFVSEENGKIEIGVVDKGKSVLFYVKDNGIGISSDKISKLFTKFYQIDTSFSRKHGGSGLGLVICKGIVTALGGEIKVESEIKKGTTFSFIMPKGDRSE